MKTDLGIQTFVTEGRELLDAMEQAILCLEADAADREAIDSLFRTAHTIKGSAGLFSFDHVVGFTHVLENTLDKLRAGQVELTDDLLSTLLRCRDHMTSLIEAEVEGDHTTLEQMAESGELLLSQLKSCPPARVSQALPATKTGSGSLVQNVNWHLSLRFPRDMLQDGMDPASFFVCLRKLGEIVSVVTVVEEMPGADEMDAESLYLGFELELQADVEKSQIESVFEFVIDRMQLRIVPPHAKLTQYAELIQELSDEKLKLGDILLQCKALTLRELAQALQVQLKEEQTRPIGEILVDQQTVTRDIVTAALTKQAEVRGSKEKEKDKDARSIRVDADKLDQLIDLVGELVVAGSGSKLLARRAGLRDMVESVDVLTGLVEGIRESVLGLRMVQIGETFKRFRRVVRDVSHELGKEIVLEVTGGDTEMDKAMVERIGDPLMHLVRNSLDHGIEPSQVRLAVGKPACGTLHLHAYHNSGYIVIEISDDGGGINQQKVMARARERGLIEPEAVLTVRETLNLIFEPGFSTADKVTGLSGRGVGMDVVKRNIESLRGSVELSSEEGKGTLVRIQLPLTLAMIDGFLVTVGGSTYVIPLETVLECVKYSEVDRQAVGAKNYLNLRGAVLPFVRLRDLFGHHEGSLGRHQYIVVVHAFGERVGLVVDELLGEFQTVIKPLGKLFHHARGVSGSTVLGTGEVALILDIPSLIRKIVNEDQRVVALNGCSELVLGAR